MFGSPMKTLAAHLSRSSFFIPCSSAGAFSVTYQFLVVPAARVSFAASLVGSVDFFVDRRGRDGLGSLDSTSSSRRGHRRRQDAMLCVSSAVLAVHCLSFSGVGRKAVSSGQRDWW
jgi:hypothetical protein